MLGFDSSDRVKNASNQWDGDGLLCVSEGRRTARETGSAGDLDRFSSAFVQTNLQERTRQ